jgi:hypothetical protein
MKDQNRKFKIALNFALLQLKSLRQTVTSIVDTKFTIKNGKLYYQISDDLKCVGDVKGDLGETGDTGPKGDKGDLGETGDTGPKGDKGDLGETGDTGPKGDKGNPGETGDTGSKGDKGNHGETGDTGSKGDKGNPGNSIEKLSLEKNSLFVTINGDKKKIGTIKLPVPFVGGGGGSRSDISQGFTQINTDIGIGDTETSDQLTLNTFQSVKWYVTASDNLGNVASQDVTAFITKGVEKHGIPAKLGKDIKFNINVDINGGFFRLRVTNNHVNDIITKVIRIVTKI